MVRFLSRWLAVVVKLDRGWTPEGPLLNPLADGARDHRLLQASISPSTAAVNLWKKQMVGPSIETRMAMTRMYCR